MTYYRLPAAERVASQTTYKNDK